MDFNFEDFVGGFFGQQKLGDFHNPNAMEYLGGVKRAVPKMSDINIDFNQRIGPEYARLGGQIEDIYDPNQRALRSATTDRILSEVQDPYSMPPELVRLITSQALEGNAATGFGASQAGRFSLGKTLGREGLEFGERRINRAAQFTRSAPLPSQLFQPITSLTPMDALNLTVGANNAQNAWNQYEAQNISTNAANIINVPLQRDLEILGAVGGAAGAFGMCWVAAEIYGGWDRPETKEARYYVAVLSPAWFYEAYMKFGERTANWLRNNPWAKPIFRKVFDGFRVKALTHMNRGANGHS